jgi:ubiquinone/menaquinone biosynthesis C-methylase UbiE
MSGRQASVIVGNVYDKYATSNPIARRLMQGFLGAVSELYLSVRPRRVLEVGCGEGHLAQHLVSLSHCPDAFHACDVSLEAVAPGLDSRLTFSAADVYDLPFTDSSFDLVVCCEVLEHLEFPDRALSEIGRVAARDVLISTPREPLWRILNLLRGKYWRDLGNTPGHVQHFSQSRLLRRISAVFDVREVRAPLPWIIVMGRVRRMVA